MRARIFASLFLCFLCSLFFVVGGDAQSPDIPFSGYMRADGEKPVWALEFFKVQPENFALAMQYLDDHRMRVRAEAKRQGEVLDYHLISNAGIVTPGHKVWDQDSIVLLTKYKLADGRRDKAVGDRRPFRNAEYSSIRGRAGDEHGVQASHQAVGFKGVTPCMRP